MNIPRPNLTSEHRKKAVLVFTWTGIALGFFVTLAASTGALAYGYDLAYRDEMYPGVAVANIRLDGLTREQARSRIASAIESSMRDGFRFTIDGEPVTVSPTVISLEDPDLAQDVVRFDIDTTVEKAYAAGRGGTFFRNSLQRLRLVLRPLRVPLAHEINRPMLIGNLESQIKERTRPAIDAEIFITVSTSTPQEILIDITDEQTGRMADLEQAADTLSVQAERLSFQTIPIQTARIEPRVKRADLERMKDQVPGLISHAPFTLAAERNTWNITSSTLAQWLGPVTKDGKTVLGIMPERVQATMQPLAEHLLQEPKDGLLVLGENLTVQEFEEPIAGVRIHAEKTVEEMTAGWKSGSTTIPLVLETVTPAIKGEDAQRLGIREVLGIGRSNYSGSPANRRRNIALGAAKMNGVIIPPGEEFSQLKSLGPINGAHGWLPELVIKGNETVPEYGGGLCQIGTTSFRAALSAGMEITERRNHSYRVRYYEPAGTDATIYEPSPDFRFKNDTAHHILITSRVQNDEVITTVWGTHDGRIAEQTKPKIWGITPPPPTKYIETTDLAPGQVRCTESAHSGAHASFDYTVSYADGTKKETTFNSYYRPWQAVCLVGVEALSTASSGTETGETSQETQEN